MTSTIPPQPWAHRPGPRSRPAPGTTPEKSAAGRSARRRGDDNEKRTFRHLILPFFPQAHRTRPGEAGGDIYTDGVGHRALEFTVASWEKLPIKMDQAAAGARQAGTTEYAVIKPRQLQPGQRRRWYAILDGEAYMRMAKELDILRALRIAVAGAPTRDKAIVAQRLAAIALDRLEATTLDHD